MDYIFVLGEQRLVKTKHFQNLDNDQMSKTEMLNVITENIFKSKIYLTDLLSPGLFTSESQDASEAHCQDAWGMNKLNTIISDTPKVPTRMPVASANH